ncbi:hypothetical protein QFZ75_008021 [Streptomyces sp. V3I8]|uniref:hypothetical protein n=1 Tax=Streptomyces sp. V3I8 TaxID=3042279 RepID=UPI00278B4D46|nr:hypothetical protein [Streptomyces sp. V3I8]MDQ1041519.1 hypothetical protein [Streptomyces sp. V3I8]
MMSSIPTPADRERHMAALVALIDQVAPGWTVHHTSQEANEGGGTAVVDHVSAHLYGGGPGYTSKQGKRSSYHVWPTEGADFEVDGLTLRVYNPSHAYVNGRRALTHEFRYAPPAGA